MSTDDFPFELPSPTLDWSTAGGPRSERFGDVYFSRQGGLAESDYVFLQMNGLAERWRALDGGSSGVFTLAETGFGTGLNFLSAARLWLATAPPSWRLHYLSVEQYPLSEAELAQALSGWNELAALAGDLIRHYPPRVPGFHCRDLAEGRIGLQLLFGDANDCLPQLLDTAVAELPTGFAVDAWFLDGFAPSRNPTLWSERVLETIGRLSAAGTTFATFTAAGEVRRRLQMAGFHIEKVAGFGSKRDMLRGRHTGTPLPTPPGASCPAPAAVDYWAWPPPARTRQRIVVIGGGLAGTSTARSLAERGFPVTLLEASSALGAGASGNPLGVLYTKLSARTGTLPRFALSSWLHAVAHYRNGFEMARWPQAAGDFCGVLQLIGDEALLAALEAQLTGHHAWVQCVDAAAASRLAGSPVESGALWFPQAGWVAPRAICVGNATHPMIEVLLDAPVTRLDRQGERWRITAGDRELEAEIVVVAAANQTADLLPDAYLPLRSIRGQITLLPSDATLTVPATIVCHEGYAAPLADGGLCIGATFDLDDRDPAPRRDSHAQNLRALAQALPGLLPAQRDAAKLEGRVGFRCTTPDYLPVVGAVSDAASLRTHYAALRKNARTVIKTPAQPLPGLYVNVGHGSRGLTSTPICAELLAAQIAGEARPLPLDLIQALHPSRFLLRALQRGRI